jgi:hypothetical protein
VSTVGELKEEFIVNLFGEDAEEFGFNKGIVKYSIKGVAKPGKPVGVSSKMYKGTLNLDPACRRGDFSFMMSRSLAARALSLMLLNWEGNPNSEWRTKRSSLCVQSPGPGTSLLRSES